MKYAQSNSNITALVCVSKTIALMACGQGDQCSALPLWWVMQYFRKIYNLKNKYRVSIETRTQEQFFDDTLFVLAC